MKATYIDYTDTHSFSSTVLAYLRQDSRLKPFISFFPDVENFGHLIENKKPLETRDTLVEVLKEQYTAIAPSGSSPVLQNIELLSKDNTYTVTTGHQLNIFTGPLYFIYKIVTAINLAKELKQAYPDKNFVPVYWMATEDHDFAEINHTKVHGKKIEWSRTAAGATGRLDTQSILETLREYQGALGLSGFSEDLCRIVEEAYTGNRKLSDATRSLVHTLFASYGLVIIDADHPALKKQLKTVIAADVVAQQSFQAINETSAALEKEGFSVQVNAREINFFYMLDGFRERITREGDRYYILNSNLQFTEEEIKAEIESHPERFSPNVVIRPVYQEIILPNIAYIGGGAEVVYWLQLKKNFDSFEVDFPILMLRNSAMITDDSFSHKLSRLHIPVKDIFKNTELLKKEWVLNHSQYRLNVADELKEFGCLFEKLKLRAYKIDPTLAPSTEAVKARLEKALSNLEQKMIKAEKRNHEGALSQIENSRNKYFPGESLQERSENFGLFYVKYGPEFIAELVRHFKPLDFKFTILEP